MNWFKKDVEVAPSTSIARNECTTHVDTPVTIGGTLTTLTQNRTTQYSYVIVPNTLYFLDTVYVDLDLSLLADCIVLRLRAVPVSNELPRPSYVASTITARNMQSRIREDFCIRDRKHVELNFPSLHSLRSVPKIFGKMNASEVGEYREEEAQISRRRGSGT
jgi:hypothetical protein